MELSSVITKSPRETIVSAKKFLEKALKEAKEDAPLIFYLEGEPKLLVSRTI